MKKLLPIIAIGIFGFAGFAFALPIFQVNQGGTGQSTFTSSQLLYGAGTNSLQTVATTSVSCSGSASCTTFTAIGASPITITGSGLSSYDAWTHPLSGWSATTTIIRTGGLYATASSTIGDGTATGGLTINGTATSTDFRVADGGTLVVGNSFPVTLGLLHPFQVLGTGSADAVGVFGRFSNGTGAPRIEFLKSRSTTIGGLGIVQNNDILSEIRFHVDDGVDYATQAAVFQVEVDDGSPAENDVGAAFVWQSLPGGGDTTLNEVMRLSADGFLGIGSTTPGTLLSIGGNATGWNFVDGTTSTSTGSGHLHVKGNLQVDGNAAFTVNLQASALTSALLQVDASGNVEEYAGTSCTNQFPRSLSALGVATCESVAPSDISLTKGNFLVGNDAGVAQATSTIFISSTGDVGIGDASPDKKLNIELTDSTVHADNNSFDGIRLTNLSGTVGTGIGVSFLNSVTGNAVSGIISRAIASDKNALDFFTEGAAGRTTKLTILDTGNVGIGTTSPLAQLHITTGGLVGSISSNADQLVLETTGVTGMTILAGASSDASIFFGDSGSQTIGRIVYGHSTDSMQFWTSALQRLTINSSGNVGIGTTTPQWLLNPFSSTASQLSLSMGAGVAQWAFRNAGGNLYLATTTVTGTATSTLSALTILGSNGFTGIATTSPFARLSVKGNDALATGYAFAISDSNNVTLFSTNNVGSTTISGSTAATSSAYIYSTAAGKGGQIILEDTGGGACTVITSEAGVLTAAVITCPTEL